MNTQSKQPTESTQQQRKEKRKVWMHLSGENAKLHPAKITQKLTALALAITIILTLSSCNELLPPTGGSESNPDSSQADPNNPSQDENGFSQYSELLQYVLQDEYYDSLIREMHRGATASAKYAPHPFGFLEDEGFDIEAIKQEEIPCYTTSYVLENEPNNLYMFTTVTNKGENTNTNYLLKYVLSEEEMADYNMIHGAKVGHYYIQSVFMNDAISQTKTPEVVGELKIRTDVYEELKKTINLKKILDTNKIHTIVYNIDQEENSFDMSIIPLHEDENKRRIVYDETYVVDISGKAFFTIENGVYTGPSNFAGMLKENTTNTNVRMYFTQGVLLTHNYSFNFEKGK